MKTEKREPRTATPARNGLYEAIENLPADTNHCLRLTTAREGRGIMNMLSKFARRGFRLSLQLDGEDILVWKKTKK